MIRTVFCNVVSVVFVATLSLAAVTQVETDHFDKVAEVVTEKQQEYGADEVLLVFDLDNTLLTSESDLGSDVWYQWQTGKFAEEQPQEGEKVDHLFDAIGLLYELAPMRLVETNIPGLIRDWQETGFTMMVLTSRGPNYRAATERELSRAGISFEQSALAPPGEAAPVYRYDAVGKGKSAAREDGSVNRREMSYMKGVMMTSGMHKGSMLDHILEKTGRRFDAVIFVDDTEKNIRNMTESFARRDDVDVTVVHYTRVEQERVAENGAVLTPEQADAMAADWKTLNETLERIFPAR
jgi:hypothetical protein